MISIIMFLVIHHMDSFGITDRKGERQEAYIQRLLEVIQKGEKITKIKEVF